MKYQIECEYGGYVRGRYYVTVEANSPEEAIELAQDDTGENEEYCEIRNDIEIQWDYAEVKEI